MSLVLLFIFAGVAVFAASGALAAARKGLDPVGVLVLAIVTATGGGTLRDVLIDRHPIFWISEPSYIGVSALAALMTWLWVKRFPPPDRSLQYADALGLAFFSIAGVQIAQAGGLTPFIAAIMGAITGCAGGLIRDVLVAEVPLIFRQSELYVTACAAGIACYLGLAALGVAEGVASTLGMSVIAFVRLASIRWGITLPILQIPER
ncbi:MAG TPA: trimeric intracellular cation channel family protein [Rhizomicrobium sp.]|nr:trimeric intracellular cation channel family protein [Rhizomicrobium sp.]